MLTRQHKREMALARYPGGGLQLIDSPTEARMVATLPNTALARDTHQLVKAGVLTGLSVEFAALAERMENGARVIERAHVPAISVVDVPAYKLARIEARSAKRRRRFFL